MNTMSRRKVSLALAGGFAAGRFATIAAQEGTPATGDATPIVEIQPVGYISLRLRQLTDAVQRPEVNEIVGVEFVPAVEALDGYAGYLLGDVIEDERQNLSIVAFEEASQIDAFNATAEAFVGGLDPKFEVETPVTAEGEAYIAAAASSSGATPEATPVVDGAAPDSGYVAVRMYTSKPGTNPLDFVQLVITGFLPIVQGLPGFQGYLLFISDGGFTSISLYDTEQAAEESSAAAANWATANLADYTDGVSQVINAAIVFADLPILAS
jgi:hypothetical protein